MTEQWLRTYTLTVGEPEPLAPPVGGGPFSIVSSSEQESLRVTFEVARDERPWPNTAEISIYNLSPAHREYCAGNRGIPCRLEAGYPGGTGTLFTGVLRGGDSVRDGHDWVTTLAAGDGEFNKSGQPLASGRIRKAWARGTPLAVVVKDFAAELNVDIGNSPALAAVASTSAGPSLLTGFAVDGPVLDEWIYLMRSCGYAWSIQDGAIQMRLAEAPAGVAPVVSPFTGLVGTVQAGSKQVKRISSIDKRETVQDIATVEGQTLLLPGLAPGLAFLLQSEAAIGTYLCHSVKHRGDTRGRAWHTDFAGHDYGG